MERISIGHDDLYNPKVDAFLSERELLGRPVPETVERSWLVRLIYSSVFYLGVAGGMGAFLGWVVLEPFFVEHRQQRGESHIINFLIFPIIGGLISLFVGAVEGVMARNPRRAALCGLVGLGIGLVGGLVSTFIANIIFAIAVAVALSFRPAGAAPPGAGGEIKGMTFALVTMGRGLAWAAAGSTVGLGQGIALRDRKILVNGLLGGVAGGLLGGLAFDPIDRLLHGPQLNSGAGASRGIGFTLIGIMVGIFIGLVENWTKTAWVLIRAGALAGKQFIVFRDPTAIGSSPKADIYLFKDAAIEPRHALIHQRGNRHEIEDLNTPDGTYVNGNPVQRQLLRSGDQIIIGKTVLEYLVKEND